ncbi:MAG TPA: 50S ribosomal protein L22 [Planctomycetota bacterium]|nr:50S ribosomal protein L22 [Planctomycetota bacterium]
MIATAQHRFARISARKARLVIDLIRGLPVSKALNVLTLTDKRASGMISKVLRSALANARQQDAHADEDAVRVAEARVDGGPMFKRIRARAMGRAVRIRRRTSHITIVLSDEKKRG